ncbi:unnamed protein product, partial [Musa acuminata subsp. malaccensis]
LLQPKHSPQRHGGQVLPHRRRVLLQGEPRQRQRARGGRVREARPCVHLRRCLSPLRHLAAFPAHPAVSAGGVGSLGRLRPPLALLPALRRRPAVGDRTGFPAGGEGGDGRFEEVMGSQHPGGH